MFVLDIIGSLGNIFGLISTIIWAVFTLIMCPVFAKIKGRNIVGWLILGILFGMFALILVIGLPQKHNKLSDLEAYEQMVRDENEARLKEKQMNKQYRNYKF